MKRELSRQGLEHLIIDFLREQSLCVIATCSKNMPRASTVEFFPIDTTIYVLTEGGQKIENILQNPHVSVAIHAPFTGWQRVKGLQITGIAEIGRKGSRVFEEGLEALNRRRQRIANVPGLMQVIKIEPRKMEYLDTTLGKEYSEVRHTLQF
jgi:general stress protein 26